MKKMFKKLYKKQYLIPFLLAFVFVMVPISLLYAQGNGTSISGDEICGSSSSTKCTLDHLKIITGKVLTFVIGIGLPLTIIFITYRFVMAWFALQQGNANAYKEALAKSRDAAIGFFLIVALAGGLLFTLLKFLGVKGGFLESLPFLSSVINVLVPHAYAQATSTATSTFVVAVATCDSAFNLLGVCSLYDFILSILRLVMRFFIYPALIVIWVWTGFAFVTAQGNPEGLNKAKKWLMWAFVTTLVIFMLQAFLVAARGTVQKILPVAPASQTTNTNTNTNSNSNNAPAPGTPGAVCTKPNGMYGRTGANGGCF